MFTYGRPFRNNTFQQRYRAFEVIYMAESRDHKLQEINKGGKTRMDVQYPMLFEITNLNSKRTTHAGVLEFCAEEGRVYLPRWMMLNLGLESGSMVDIKNVHLSAGTFVKLEPQHVDFLDISNPRAVLEKALRQYSCLSEDDTLTLFYNDKEYNLRVIETQPSKAISIIECDLNVDFAPPVGYVEPARVPRILTPVQPAEPPIPSFATPPPSTSDMDESSTDRNKVKPFAAFGGSGHRIDGKTKTSKNKRTTDPNPVKKDSATSSAAASLSQDDDEEIHYIKGRLHFTMGDPTAKSSADTAAAVAALENMDQSETDKGKPDFEAFKGLGKKLR